MSLREVMLGCFKTPLWWLEGIYSSRLNRSLLCCCYLKYIQSAGKGKKIELSMVKLRALKMILLTTPNSPVTGANDTMALWQQHAGSRGGEGTGGEDTWELLNSSGVYKNG